MLLRARIHSTGWGTSTRVGDRTKPLDYRAAWRGGKNNRVPGQYKQLLIDGDTERGPREGIPITTTCAQTDRPRFAAMLGGLPFLAPAARRCARKISATRISAASIQVVIEEAVLNLARQAQVETGHCRTCDTRNSLLMPACLFSICDARAVLAGM